MNKIRTYISNIQTHFSRLELARKIRLMLLLVSLIPLVCLLVVVYQISSSIIHSQTNELIQANLEQSASNVGSFWRTCEGILSRRYIRMIFIGIKWNTSIDGMQVSIMMQKQRSADVWKILLSAIQVLWESLLSEKNMTFAFMMK